MIHISVTKQTDNIPKGTYNQMVVIASSRKKKPDCSVKKILLTIITATIFLVACICFAFYEIQSESSSGLITASNTSKSSNLRSSTITSSYKLIDDLITKCKSRGLFKKRRNDGLWDFLIEEAVAYRKENGNIEINVMEVGMHSASQCIQAATLDLQSFCVEPSPNSLERIMKSFEKASPLTRRNIRFYQMAAGSSSGVDLEFSSSGGTGDHVGGAIDVWKMEKLPNAEQPKHEQKVTVKSVAIDDIIIADNPIEPTEDYTGKVINIGMNKMFLVKVDTQGFEPSVFSGLKKSIANHMIDYVITEYWPKGIDFMNDMTEKCVKPVEILELLASNGYKLFANFNVAHPSSDVPKEAKHYLNDGRINKIPYHDLKLHCMFYYDVERMFPSDTYKMGYWTDILAVAPHARLPNVPVSELGNLLKPHLIQ